MIRAIKSFIDEGKLLHPGDVVAMTDEARIERCVSLGLVEVVEEKEEEPKEKPKKAAPKKKAKK